MDVAALPRCLPVSCAAAQTGQTAAGIWDQGAMHNKPCTTSSAMLASEALSCSTGCMPQPFQIVTAACASFPCFD